MTCMAHLMYLQERLSLLLILLVITQLSINRGVCLPVDLSSKFASITYSLSPDFTSTLRSGHPLLPPPPPPPVLNVHVM